MQNLGWHNFSNELMLFHGALKQFLQEPAVNLEKMKKEAVSMKVFIETVIDNPREVSDGN
jgi:hypothetical protein